MTPTDKMELQVEENRDGSASVQIAPADNSLNQESELVKLIQENNDELDDDHNDDHNDPIASDDPDREAIREARREERKLKKQLHKEKARESNHLISALRKQNQELAVRVATMEKKTFGAELARVDKAIEDAAVQVEYAKMQMKDAVTHSNGDALTKAQELWYEAQRKLESLKVMKDTATKQTNNQPQTLQADPVVKRLASDWVERNSWYDPEGKDLDSEIAQRIDRKLTEEGYDPASDDYWDEMDFRIKKYLPHRAESGYNTQNNRSQRPRSMVVSSGRESMATAKPGEMRVAPERVAAMKEAGLWDNPKLRQKALENYAKWDRENKQRS
jgi:hypothetical protein